MMLLYKLIAFILGIIIGSIIIYMIVFIYFYFAKCILKIKIWQNKNDMEVRNIEDLKRIMEREIWKDDISNQNK